LLQVDKSLGQLVTLSQFIFAALMALPEQLVPISCFPYRTLRKPNAPIWFYFLLTGVFAVSSILNNLVFEYGVSVPLQLLLRSCSVMTSLLMGIAFFGKTYNFGQTMSSIVLTIGMAIVTITDVSLAGPVKKECCDQLPNSVPKDALFSNVCPSFLPSLTDLLIFRILLFWIRF
jgi:UDP-xylose/UDP-N-acetylglucosamine transporter B4